MDATKIYRRTRAPGTTTAILALLLVVCLAESATGSCLSYGHSCWGAHGKRSAPDWYLTRMLRRMASNTETNRDRHLSAANDDISAIFQVEGPRDTTANERPMPENEDLPFETAPKGLEAKPMLDEDILSKIKIWQIMREASQEN